MFKKLAWRFARHAIYAGVSALVGVVSNKYGLPPTITTAALTGVMSALDKHLGVGGLVKP